MVKLYVILDTGLVPKEKIIKVAEEILEAGADLLQLRDKTSPDREVKALSEDLAALAREKRVPFLVNDRLRVAEALGVGVHLGDGDPPVSVARRVLPPEALVGRSCYGSVEKGLLAQKMGASYAAFGSVFPTKTKLSARVIDRKVLEEAGQRLGIPVVAIGGITPENVKELLKYPLWAVAVASAVVSAPRPAEAVKRFKEILCSF